MPTRTLVAPKTPTPYTRVTADGKGTTVNLTFSFDSIGRTDPIAQTFNNVRGLVHRADGSYGVIDRHGKRVAEVNAHWQLALVNLSIHEVTSWDRP